MKTYKRLRQDTPPHCVHSHKRKKLLCAHVCNPKRTVWKKESVCACICFCLVVSPFCGLSWILPLNIRGNLECTICFELAVPWNLFWKPGDTEST